MINVRARSVIERWLAVIGSIPDDGLSRRHTDMAGQRSAESGVSDKYFLPANAQRYCDTVIGE
jgi:hypothetical protein